MSTAFLAQLTGDLTTMLSDFGQTATVGGVSITAIFDNEYIDVNLSMGDVASASPAIHCKSADVTTAAKGTAVTVGGASYTVSHPPKPDGTGMTTLVLKKS